MNVVIAGGGIVGQTLAQELSEEGVDIVLIEKDAELLDKIIARVDITGLAGNTASYENLIEAGVDEADIFISVTSSDEINLISAIMAKRIGARHTIARVRNPEYTHHSDFMRQDLGITMIINPEQVAAQDIAQTIKFPDANSVEYFAQGKVSMVEVTISKDSPINGMSLIKFGQVYKDILAITIEREDDVIVPSGNAVIHEGDNIFVIGSRPAINSFYKSAGYRNERIHNSLIIGQSQITYYLIELLNTIHVDVKVVCQDYDQAKQYSQDFSKAVIVHGDPTDQDFLREEGISSYDSVIAVSDTDEENILTSLIALSEHVEKVITKVSNVSLLKILGGLELPSIVTPKYIMANRILRFIRSLSSSKVSSVEQLIRIANNQVEILQFLVKEGCQAVDIPLAELETKDETLVAFITRQDELIIPRGSDTIQVGDHVIIVTSHPHFDHVDDILAEETRS